MSLSAVSPAQAGRLPVCRAAELAAAPPATAWLVEGLWSTRAVGIVGGEPKCGKSFLALDLAVAVASGAPCLRRFAVPRPGPVLLYAAEDALHVVRERLVGIAAAAGVDFAALDVHVITAPRLRLDLPEDRRRLQATVAALRPVLLVLDPLVRLHRVDENVAAEVAPLLAELRALERRFATAVLLVHHARKGAAHVRAGQALRGSSELHAWVDSGLYLRRHGDRLHLTIEHRAAPAGADLTLALQADAGALALQVVAAGAPAAGAADVQPSAADRIAQTLAAAAGPLSLRQLRGACHMRNATLCEAVAALTAAGRLRKTPAGYALVDR